MLKSLCGVLLAFVLALAVAPDVGAKQRGYVVPGSQTSRFSLHGSNGYQLDVSSSGRWVDVLATGAGSKSLVNYHVRRHRHGRDGFEAKLPGIGRVAVEFRSRKVRSLRPERGCTGKRGRLELGTFVGTIDFRGERGFTEVTATRAPGRIRREYRQTCSIEGSGDGNNGQGKSFDEMVTSTTLTALTPRGGLFFLANRVEFSGRLHKELELPDFLTYTAMQVDRSRGMQILRMVYDYGTLESFTAERTGRAASARVEPPEPFSGTADFAVATDRNVSWTGDLSVAFPGTDPIRFTGKRFETELCVDRKCAGDSVRPSRSLTAGIFNLLVDRAPSSAAPTPRLWPR